MAIEGKRLESIDDSHPIWLISSSLDYKTTSSKIKYDVETQKTQVTEYTPVARGGGGQFETLLADVHYQGGHFWTRIS